MLRCAIHDGVVWQLTFQRRLRMMPFVDTIEIRGDCAILIGDYRLRPKRVTGADCRSIGTLPSNRH